MGKREIPEQHAEHHYATPPIRRASRTQDEEVPAASPHRIGQHAGLHPEDMLYTTEDRPLRLRRREEEDQEDDEQENEPVAVSSLAPRSSLPYRAEVQVDRQGRPYILLGNTKVILNDGPPPMPRQRRSMADAQTERLRATEPLPPKRRSMHWLFFMGVGMLFMLPLFLGGSALLNWLHVTVDDLQYGRPRTYQCDATVGHKDSPDNPSHFIVVNRNRRIEITEYPGGDVSHARIFLGPTLYGEGQDLTPVTLSFKDVNGDHKPDMLVHILDANTIMVFLNTGVTFRPLQPGEHVTL